MVKTDKISLFAPQKQPDEPIDGPYYTEPSYTTINIDESNSEKILPERIGVKLGDIFPNPFKSLKPKIFSQRSSHGKRFE